jgi:hypothetical protein
MAPIRFGSSWQVTARARIPSGTLSRRSSGICDVAGETMAFGEGMALYYGTFSL